MKYEILKQCHPTYNGNLIRRLSILYNGGEELIRHACEYIPQGSSETEPTYEEKLSFANCYNGAFSTNIDQIGAYLFSKEVSVMAISGNGDMEVYKDFMANADGAGESLVNVCSDLWTRGQIYRPGYLGIDFRAVEGAAPLFADEEKKRGLGIPYTYNIAPESVIDWECDQFGEFKWLKLFKEYCELKSPFDARTSRVMQFKVWTMSSAGFAQFQVFEVQCEEGKDPEDTDDVTLVREGVTTFKRIPVRRYDPGQGLWIGNKIGFTIANNFRQRVNYQFALNRVMNPVGVFKYGPDSDTESSAANNSNRGQIAKSDAEEYGWIEMSAADEFEFKVPPSEHFSMILDSLKEGDDAVQKAISNMAQTHAAQQSNTARSAASKMADNRALEIVLNTYGKQQRATIKDVVDTISEARGEDLLWEVQGLEDYEVEDPADVLNEALSMNAIDIKSVSFKRDHEVSIARKLRKESTPEQQQVYADEIAAWYAANGASVIESMEHKLATPDDPEDEEEAPKDDKPKDKEPPAKE